jgi:hypothetical protein
MVLALVQVLNSTDILNFDQSQRFSLPCTTSEEVIMQLDELYQLLENVHTDEDDPMSKVSNKALSQAVSGLTTTTMMMVMMMMMMMMMMMLMVMVMTMVVVVMMG